MAPYHFSYPSMGTKWAITIWDPMPSDKTEQLSRAIVQHSQEFDSTYSRFIKTSLIWQIAQAAGTYQVPTDLIKMLQLYIALYPLTNKKLNPLIGFTISDLGYDADYTLKPKDLIRAVPDLEETLEILDETHVRTTLPVLIDLGALGKGYFVDCLTGFLREQGIRRFLVDGSGDIYYQGTEEILAGLEHPNDKTKVIGSLGLANAALCASGTDRRRWREYHHIIDPETITSPQEISAVWVRAEQAALADGLATALFFVPPENLLKQFQFDYCILNAAFRLKKSANFLAEFY